MNSDRCYCTSYIDKLFTYPLEFLDRETKQCVFCAFTNGPEGWDYPRLRTIIAIIDQPGSGKVVPFVQGLPAFSHYTQTFMEDGSPDNLTASK